jgi:hypothetical protein
MDDMSVDAPGPKNVAANARHLRRTIGIVISARGEHSGTAASALVPASLKHQH